jgi:hypothetical protein
MKRISIVALLLLSVLSVSCGSGSSKDKSIDGTYYFQDSVSRSTVTISGDNWSMKTQFGAPGYYGSPKYDSGKVKGNTLYHSGIIAYGKVSGRTLRIGGRSYSKR